MDTINQFFVTVKRFVSIAHSLNSEKFDKARNLHGATYEVLVTVYSPELDELNLVIDMVELDHILEEILGVLDYQNLDNLPQFKEMLTTTEFIAKYIFDSLRSQLVNKKEERSVNPKLQSLKVELMENSLYSAGFFGDL